MARVSLSQQQIDDVIKLRQGGVGWLKIQRETGINRLRAKRAYEKWVRSQTLEELKEARREVAAEEFRKHMQYLISLAESLIDVLQIPPNPETTATSEELLSRFWSSDLTSNNNAPESTESPDFPLRRVRNYGLIKRENAMLLESLKSHTREKIRWQGFEDWRSAWDSYIAISNYLGQTSYKIFNNYLKQEKDEDLLRKIKKQSGRRDALELMAHKSFNKVWQLAFDDPKKETQFEIVRPESGLPDDWYLTLDGNTIFKLNEQLLAEKVSRIGNETIKNLFQGKTSDVVKTLQEKVALVNQFAQELEEKLNPLILRPLILRTRCDLCPA